MWCFDCDCMLFLFVWFDSPLNDLLFHFQTLRLYHNMHILIISTHIQTDTTNKQKNEQKHSCTTTNRKYSWTAEKNTERQKSWDFLCFQPTVSALIFSDKQMSTCFLTSLLFNPFITVWVSVNSLDCYLDSSSLPFDILILCYFLHCHK